MTFRDVILAEPTLYDYFELNEEEVPDPQYFASSTSTGNQLLRHGYDGLWLQQQTGMNPLLMAAVQILSDGTDRDDLWIDGTSSLNVGSPWSVELIVKLSSFAHNAAIFSLSATNTLTLMHDPTVGLSLTLNEVSFATYPKPSTTSFQDGAYHHIVLTVNGSSVQCYVDNVLAINVTQVLGLSGSPTSTLAKTQYPGTTYLSTLGYYDELIFYSSALDSTQINAHYTAINAPEPSSPFSLVVEAESSLTNYFRFREYRGPFHFGPDFFSETGEEMFRYGDDTIDSYRVGSQVDYGYFFAQRTGSDYFTGAEFNPSDGSFMQAGSPWSFEIILRIDEPTLESVVFGVQDYNMGNSIVLTHDPMSGFRLSINETFIASYAHPSTTTFEDGAFHHLVVTVNEPTIEFYVDNVLALSLTQTIGIDSVYGMDVTIGFTYAPSGTYQSLWGVFDEMALYNAVLTSTQVTDHYNAAFAASATTRRLDVVTDGYIFLESLPLTNIPLSFFRGGDASFPFDGDGQFEFWRGGTSPVLGLDQIANKIDLFTDGYVFDAEPIHEVITDGLIQETQALEVVGDGWVWAETSVVTDGIVVGTNLRLYPRDSSARIYQDNRFYPVEP